MASSIERVFVAGAGLMGHGIAQVHAAIGLPVTLYEPDLARAEAGRDRIASQPRSGGGQGPPQPGGPRRHAWRASSRRPTSGASPTADLVIEAVFEDLAVKSALWRELDALAPPAAIFASNTSSIAIHRLAEAVARERRERFVGMHFFSPVPVMPLIELIRGRDTDDETELAIRALGERLGKQVIVSADRPGFIVNRILMPFLAESMRAYQEGLGTADDIDAGARVGLNHPMGPLELADFIGLDVCLGVMRVLEDGLGGEHFRPPNVLVGARRGGSSRPEDRAGLLHLSARAGRGFEGVTGGLAGGLTEEERLLQATAREFATRELAPTAIERDEEERYDRSLFTKMGELGLTAAPLPESVGGAGFSYLGWTLVMEELGAADMSMAVSLSVHILSQYPVVTWGTPEQHARWLPPMLTGEALGAFALTEPHAGSDAAAIRTRAERVGPADAPTAYRLTGTKIWISNAPEADRYLVFATLDPEAGAKGITAFLVEKGTPGFRFGAHERKMGIRACPAAELVFDGAEVPAAQPARRGGRGLQDRAVRARGGPDLDRGRVRRDRAGRAGGVGSLSRATEGVRRAARRAAGPPVHAGRDGPRGRRRAGRDPRGGAGQGPRRIDRRGLVDRQVDRVRHRDAGGDRRRPAVRGERLLARDRAWSA